jgi:Rab3 GTPase-activating protein catalytic subunit
VLWIYVSVDRPLFVPMSQPSASLTADQLEAEAEMLGRLGDEAAEQMRRERAEAGLVSDMSAFKAANPGSILEDFVRWHSPKDWRRKDEAGKEDQNGGSLEEEKKRQAGKKEQERSDSERCGDSDWRVTAMAKTRRDHRRGELSVRMRHRNNRWQKLWRVDTHPTP